MQVFLLLLDKLSSIYHVQIWPDRIHVRDRRTGKFFDQKPLVAFERRSGKGTGRVARSRVVAVGNAAAEAAAENIEIINPFLHPRTPIADFMAAEVLLQSVFRSLSGASLFRLRPQVVIQPMESWEGGLTPIELRAFREMALGAGAREALVWQGDPLRLQELDFVALKAECADHSA